MSELVVMVNPDTGRKADVPLTEVERWQGWGWRLASNEPEAVIAPVVAKGPRGKFYVKQGGKIISDPFDNELEADMHLKALTAPKAEE